MGWSQAMIEGVLLAATATDDRNAEAAQGGMVASLAQTVTTRTRELASRGAMERRTALRDIAVRLRPTAVPAGTVLPPRVRGLLAAGQPAAVARSWSAEAPAPRRGFAAAPALRETLRRFAVAPASAAVRRAQRRELMEAGWHA